MQTLSCECDREGQGDKASWIVAAWNTRAGSNEEKEREINNRRFNKLNNLSTESKFLSYSHTVCTPFLPFDFYFLSCALFAIIK